MKILKTPLFLVIALNVVFGFFIGAFGFPKWQQVVEHAQNISGVVNYPITTPFVQIHQSFWTINSQIISLFLLIGFSEKTLTVVVSGLLGAVSFSGVGLFFYALTKNKILAVTIPVVFYLSNIYDYRVSYPVWLLGHSQTYVVIALSYVLLTLSLLGLGYYSIFGFLLGVAPAIHLSWAVFLWLIIFLSLLFERQKLPKLLRKIIPYFLLGLTVTILSFIYWLHFSPETLKTYGAVTTDYVNTFMKYWDSHRRPVVIFARPAVMLYSSTLLFLVCLHNQKGFIKTEMTIVIRALSIAGLVGIVSIILTHLPQQYLPIKLLNIIPTRWTSLNILCYPLLLVGIFSSYLRKSTEKFLFIVATLLALSLNDLVRFYFLLFTTAIVIVIVLFPSVNKYFIHISHFILKSSCSYLIKLFLASVIIGICITSTIPKLIGEWGKYSEQFIINPSDVKFIQPKGVVLTASRMNYVQAQTRWPILINTEDLDSSVYAASDEMASQVKNILSDVYGVNYSKPPIDIIINHPGGLLRDTSKNVWESRSKEEWQVLGKKYDFSIIISWPEWKLHLPKIVQGEGYSIYSL